jgi:hypothetical protein
MYWLVKASMPCALIVVTACVGISDGQDGVGVTVRDSVGVQIVEVPGSVLDELPVWHLSEEPILSIGQVEGSEPYLFSGVSSVTALNDGGYALVDSRSSEVRIFDDAGLFVTKIGRLGDGPGEFRSSPIITEGLEGGIVAFDWFSARISSFDRSGSLLETWQWDTQECQLAMIGSSSAVPCVPRGLLANGTPVLLNQEHPAPNAELLGQDFTNLQAFVGVAMPDGYKQLDSLSLPKVSVVEYTQTNGITRVVGDVPILAPLPLVLVGREHIAVAMQDRYEFRVYNSGGTLVRIIRVDRPGPPVSAADRRMLIGYDPPLAAAPEVVGVVDRLPAMGTSPRFGDGDELWVPDFRYPALTGVDAPAMITIFGADGLPKGRLEVRLDPIFGDQRAMSDARSGPDEYRVVTRDALDVERLLVFRIIKE